MIIRIVILVIAAIVVVFVVGFLLLLRIIPLELSQEETEEDFLKNQEDIMIVTTYLLSLDDESIIIHASEYDGTMFTSTDGKRTIDDPIVLRAMDELLKRNDYKSIGKHKNAIDFVRSAPTLDYCSGVAYSIDGSEPQLQFLTFAEPLSEPNWFYCEENYNLWRQRNSPE